MVLEDVPGVTPERDAASAPAAGSPPTGKSVTPRPRYVIVVARDQPDLWRHLRQSVGEIHGVHVVLDRRHGGRWAWARSWDERHDVDRRRGADDANRLSYPSVFTIHPEGSSSTPS